MEETLIKRSMPNSLDAEQSVIGSMIMDKDAILTAMEMLTSDDFYHKQMCIRDSCGNWTYDRGRSGVWRRKKRGSKILYYKINRICRDRADYFVCGHIPYQSSNHASCRHGG